MAAVPNPLAGSANATIGAPTTVAGQLDRPYSQYTDVNLTGIAVLRISRSATLLPNENNPHIEHFEAKRIIDRIVEKASEMQKAAVIAVADSLDELFTFARMDAWVGIGRQSESFIRQSWNTSDKSTD